MHLVFDAGFSGSSLDTATWDTCYPWFGGGTATSGCTNFGNNEREWYLPSQDQVSNGELDLVASNTPTVGTDQSGSPETYPWRSGMVTTYGSFDFTYGFVEVTARIPSGAGFWPALWLLPENESWPPEIDIMENLGSNVESVSCTIHPSSGGQEQESYTSPSSLASGWHTYAIDWEPGSITWYVDGQEVFRYTADVPSEPMYFLANLAISGADLSNSSAPANGSFAIQSVKIYQH